MNHKDQVLLDPFQVTNVSVAHAHGCKVMVQVGSMEHAKQALQAGVDAIIAQGSEAGGHGLYPDTGSGTLPLAAAIVSMVRREISEKAGLPVLAAGGIVDGRGVAAALALGCDGAVLGTRLWASEEALGNSTAKQMLAAEENGPDQVIRTKVRDWIQNQFTPTPWPAPFDSVGMLKNSTTDRWHGNEEELKKFLAEEAGAGGGNYKECRHEKNSTNSVHLPAANKSSNCSSISISYRQADTEDNYQIASVLAGKGIGDIDRVEKAGEIVSRVCKEAEEIIRGTLRACLSEA